MNQFYFTFQDSCENVAVSTFTPSDNGGKQAFTVTGYTISDYLDEGDELAFVYDSNYYVYTIIDITGDQLTMSFDYNAAITNVNTVLQFSIKVTANPNNFNKGKFEWNKDKDNYFYRLKYSGKLRFKGADYDYLYAVLNEGCCKVTFKVFKLCDGVYSLFYRAIINKTEGTWNDSMCWFDSEILPLDKYHCILEDSNTEKNIFSDLYWSSASMIEDDAIEGNDSGPFFEYTVQPIAPTAPGTTFDIADGGALFIELNTYSGEAVDPNTGNAWCVFVRERRVFIYDWNFAFTAPVLSGYTNTLETIFGDKITIVYTRQVSYSLFTPSLRDAPEITAVVWGSGGSCPNNVYGVLYDAVNDNCIYLTRYNINTSTDIVAYPTLQLQGAFVSLTSGCTNISGVTSDFLEMNPIGDTAGYVSGENYVTGLENFVSNLHLTNIGFVQIPIFNLDAVINMSFSSLMKNLNYILNVYWFIDSSNRLRIEHDSWFTNNLIVDLSLTANNKYKKEYTYIKEEIPNRERFTFKHNKNTDFVGVDIVYDNQCTASPKILTRASDWSTDINYIRNAGGNLPDQDIVLFAVQFGGADILIETGVLTDIQMPNGHLSWANLHDNYHRYGRILQTGQMNLADETFDSFKKFRKQNNQKLIECCLDVPINQGTVITELGTGDATKITYDINNNTYSFELNI